MRVTDAWAACMQERVLAWPARDLKKAVGRTMEYVMSPAVCRASSSFSLACWNSSKGFCTQIALNSTKCAAPFSLATSRTFFVA